MPPRETPHRQPTRTQYGPYARELGQRRQGYVQTASPASPSGSRKPSRAYRQTTTYHRLKRSQTLHCGGDCMLFD